MKRSNPEDWSTPAYTSHSDLYCGVNVPDETGKMSRSDKRGATLPKVATVTTLLRNDVVIKRCARNYKLSYKCFYSLFYFAEICYT